VRVAVLTDDLCGVGEPVTLGLETIVNLLRTARRTSIILGPAAGFELRLSLGYSVTSYS
jgi:hypothetical protein